MEKLNLHSVETELKKRWAYPYVWGQKQNDLWDGHTNFIYSTPSWEALMPQMAKVVNSLKLEKRALFNYTINRWYNFWSARAVEQIFCESEHIVPVTQMKDSEKDFFLCGIPFDHKTSVFPRQFKKSFAYAQTHKTELIEWLYKNQSTQKRHHLKNRLFIVVYAENGEHWKLKAEIGLIKKFIQKYVAGFNREELHSFAFANNQQALSDIIWIVN